MARSRSRSVRLLLALGACLALGFAAAWGALYLGVLRDLPDLRSLQDYRPLLSSRVYDRAGRLIGEFYDERRFLVPLEAVPEHVIRAFVASEDDAFFQHQGLDYRSIVRAAWVNLRAGGEIRQGGSTITQQVAKTLLLTPERRYTRKLKDMLLARRIEQRFSKEEILYLYLNQIYFGHGAYGIGEAARTYFGVTPGELSISQAALLAGLPRAPSSYSPYRDPQAAEARRQYVLRRMYEEGYVNESSYEESLADRPALADPPEKDDMAAAAWLAEEVRRHLFEVFGGERVRRDGLVIETTLDLDAQRAAQAALRSGLEALDHRQGYRGPVRRVAPDEIEASLGDLARENAGAPADGPLLGVVTAVDAKAGAARVAFGPGQGGEVRLEDVRWARTPDPARYPAPVGSIERVFRVGDVTRFVRRAGEARLLLHQEPLVEGSLLAFEVETGDVLAMVGGYDFERSEFNRVTQARRQPGSAFKPIVYGAALREGWTAASTIVDRPVVYEDPASGFVWRPGNYKGEFYGRITLRSALARSVNNATIHLLTAVGVDDVIDYARTLGIESPMERNLSLALGSSGLSLLELTRAYAVFPAQGRRVVPRFIARVLDADGEVLLENVPLGSAFAEEQPPEVLSPLDAYLATDMLRAVVEERDGTGRQARALGRPLGGKTGTTNEQADAWFVGFSPDLVTGVWVGFDEKRVLGRGETGGHAALPIWIDFMREALAKRPRRDFTVPEGVVFARVDRASGLLAGPRSTDTYFQAFAEGKVPTETAGSVTASEGDRRLRLDAF